jgi:hypothetical protein
MSVVVLWGHDHEQKNEQKNTIGCFFYLPNWLSIFVSWSASGTGKEIFFDFRDGGTGRVPVVIWMSSWHYRFFVVLCDG